MRKFWILSLLIIFFSCSENKENDELEAVFKQHKVYGSILIYDQKADIEYGYNLDRADSGFLPASTFKIVNSLIGLETGLVNLSDTVFVWDSLPRRMEAWEKNMTLNEAFQLSCVPCYQELARKIGADRMNDYLNKFDYGNMVVDENSIDKFWLEGESRITQRQQIDFLKRLYNQELDIDESTYSKIKELMVIKKNEDYTLSGKTGWAIRNGNNVGWFVGYFEVNENIFFVATNIEPYDKTEMIGFTTARKDITMEVMILLELIK